MSTEDYGVGTCIARSIQVQFPDGQREGSLWALDDHCHYARVDGLNYAVLETGTLDTVFARFNGNNPVYQGFQIDADLEKGFEGY